MFKRWVGAAALAVAGCSANHYVESADREGYAISAEKMRIVDDFRRDLDDPREHELPARQPEKAPIDVPKMMALEDAVRIAVKFSREYRTQQEVYYLSALNLSLVRRDFLEPVFGGSLSYDGTEGRSIELSDSTALAVSATQRLPTGGFATLSTSANVNTIAIGNERTQDSGFTGTISISQQLWRGAGRKIAFEPLTQAERDVVYAARVFEQFRQNFTIGIIRSYLNLVTAKLGLGITKSQVERQERALKQSRAQFRVGRARQEDTLRAAETYLNAENAFLDAEQAFKVQKDRFKIDLGLPIDVDFEIADDIPEPVAFPLNADGAVSAALYNRLDLLTQRERLTDTMRRVAIARNSLSPDLDLDASYSAFSGIVNSLRELSINNEVATFGLSLRFPFDRKAERNAYKGALISLDQSRRALSRTEDNVIVDIRNQVRDLRTQTLTIQNERENIEVLRRRIIRARLDFQAGLASNRDEIEANDNYAAAQNRLLARYVTYHIARLDLLQQMGLLFVDKEGMIIP